MSGWQGDPDSPVVSVCCITYNHGEYIEDALNGILSQKTDFPFEILINDDASTDETSEILRKYEEKYPRIIKLICQAENKFSQGLSPNLTYNFPRAQGRFIALCEGDDFWISENKLEKQVAALTENPGCVLCFHDAYKVDENREVLAEIVPANNKYLSPKKLARSPFTPTFTRMFRNVGFPWEGERNLPTAMDVCLAAYLSKFGGAVYLGAEVLSAYRVHGGGVWSLKSQCQKTRMTVDSKLYMAGHFKVDIDDAVANDAFEYHMTTAATTILDQLEFSSAFQATMKYLVLRCYRHIRWVAVHLISPLRNKLRSR
ncbi:MAG: glycosyltransferase [Marinobacter sp.]